MRYRDIVPAKAIDITKVTQKQMAAHDAKSLPVQSDRAIRGRVRNTLAADIAQSDQANIEPTNFDKAMAFRHFCMTKNAANRDAETQANKAAALRKGGGAVG